MGGLLSPDHDSDGCGNYIVNCGNNNYARPSCNNSHCTVASGNTGVNCGTTYWTNSEICRAAGMINEA